MKDWMGRTDASSSSIAPDEAPRYEIWLLKLVPNTRFGRWWSALALMVVTSSTFSLSGALDGAFGDGQTWAAALFFCVILAYIVPVFHLVTQRTEDAFDALRPRLNLTPAEVIAARRSIRTRTAPWVVRSSLVGLTLWLGQSFLLAGGLTEMFGALTADVLDFSMAIGALFVWLFVTCTALALVGNAWLFRRLTQDLEIDLLDPDALTPVGRMAVNSTLVLIGALASFPIMWAGDDTDPWTTIPGAIVLLLVMATLFLVSTWPMHVALRTARLEELARIQTRINARRSAGDPLDDERLVVLEPLLAYRREIAAAREWPLDLDALARFGLYLVIVPLTWVGAALIEYAVDLFIDG